jgi:hypothetical protein
MLSKSKMPRKNAPRFPGGSLNVTKAKKKRQATVLAVLGLEPRLARIWIGWF